MLFSTPAQATLPGIPDAVETEIQIHEIAPRGRHSEIECRARSKVGLLPDTRLILELPEDARLTGGVDHLDEALADAESNGFTARVIFTESGVKEVMCVAASPSQAHHAAGAMEFLEIGPDSASVGGRPVDPERPLSVVWPDGPDVVRLPSEASYPVPHRTAPPPPAPTELMAGLPFAEAVRTPPSRRSLTVTINGRFQFIGRSGTPTSEVALVEVIDATDNSVRHSCYTAVDGYYSCGPFALPPGNAVRVRWASYAVSHGDTIMVLNPVLGTAETVDNTWSFSTGNVLTAVSGTYNFGTYVLDGDTPPTGTYAGFRAHKDMVELWRYLYNEAGVHESPVETAGSGIAEFHPNSTDTGYEFATQHILLEPWSASTDIIQHEYGHSMMHRHYPVYPPFHNCGEHFHHKLSSEGCAWSEGWASFVALLPDHDPVFYYPGPDVNLETPTWGTPGWDNGIAVEGRVSGALWDVLDAVPDGHDQYTDLNIRRIWTVYYDDTPLTFQEFIDDWVARGYPTAGPMGALYQNTIQ